MNMDPEPVDGWIQLTSGATVPLPSRFSVLGAPLVSFERRSPWVFQQLSSRGRQTPRGAEAASEGARRPARIAPAMEDHADVASGRNVTVRTQGGCRIGKGPGAPPDDPRLSAEKNLESVYVVQGFLVGEKKGEMGTSLDDGQVRWPRESRERVLTTRA